MSAGWCPRVIYNPGGGNVIVDFSLPQRPWTFEPQAVGGMRIAGSGLSAAYRVRHDELTTHVLRFTEEEWPDVRTWVLWAQEQTTFLWQDDQADVLTQVEVYLQAPAMGDPVRPVRDPQFPAVMDLAITLRRANGNAATRAYFETEEES